MSLAGVHKIDVFYVETCNFDGPSRASVDGHEKPPPSRPNRRDQHDAARPRSGHGQEPDDRFAYCRHLDALALLGHDPGHIQTERVRESHREDLLK
jgi:hypothetical protein